MTWRQKLIEVALPLEAINRESAREKSIRHGHPSTLHLWWARRPLAACRAVLFAQLVDDPSAHPEEFPTEADQEAERKRLFDLIERLVVWENANDEALLSEAHAEILKSTGGKPPPILDPFAGGGSIPLEAQRLGLTAHASDLNPVAVLINKALIEIPPKWAGRPPVFPGAAGAAMGDWPRVVGLAEDVRRYGQWMRDEAEKRIGHLYPKAALADGTRANVIAWIWARTITCPNPACGVAMPLVRSFWLSKKRDRPTWLRPIVSGKDITFEVHVGREGPNPEGTVGRQGATCVTCDTPVPLAYVRQVSRESGMGAQLMAVVGEGDRRRVYLPPSMDQIDAASVAPPTSLPEGELFDWPGRINVYRYGLTEFWQLFTNRQLVALSTFSDLVGEAHSQVLRDATAALMDTHEAHSYADAVALYLGFAVSRLANENSTICTWANNPSKEHLRSTFARQALPMTWDFGEANPFFGSTGGLLESLARVCTAIERLPAASARGHAVQEDAMNIAVGGACVSTDPPYYDNIGYADLSDFFYVWLRRSLSRFYPNETATLLTPKGPELVATPYRFGGSKSKAEEHFESGFVKTFTRVRAQHAAGIPLTVFYAFKQAESDDSGTASTGWETMLNGLMQAGLMVTATWPMRTERSGRTIGLGNNALASSIVLACRPRPSTAEAVNRRQLISALKAELPLALRNMQQGSVAPVDLAQATIGPGMAVFSRYARVVEADGSDMSVRTALALINQVLDEVLVEQEGDFDADTRFCVKWFSQFGWNEAASGEADVLARATNTAVNGLVRGGVFRAVAGKARLLAPEELSADWDPWTDERVSVWEVVVRLAHALTEVGVDGAAPLFASAGQRVDLDTAQELAYLLYALCEKKGWVESARLFNALGSSWSDVTTASRSLRQDQGSQSAFDFHDEGSEA